MFFDLSEKTGAPRENSCMQGENIYELHTEWPLARMQSSNLRSDSSNHCTAVPYIFYPYFQIDVLPPQNNSNKNLLSCKIKTLQLVRLDYQSLDGMCRDGHKWPTTERSVDKSRKRVTAAKNLLWHRFNLLPVNLNVTSKHHKLHNTFCQFVFAAHCLVCLNGQAVPAMTPYRWNSVLIDLRFW